MPSGHFQPFQLLLFWLLTLSCFQLLPGAETLLLSMPPLLQLLLLLQLLPLEPLSTSC
jgi:hypothetical protein